MSPKSSSLIISVIAISLILSINSAYAEQVTCWIETPSLTAIDTDSFIWTHCTGVGCNELNNIDPACTTSCPDTNSTCCQEEGQYTWLVSSSRAVSTWTCPGTVSGSQCSGNAYLVSWDGSQTWCDCYMGSGYWNLGGEVSATSCCGDDSGESSNTRLCNSGCSSSGSDDACCSLATDCVYSDQCYDTGTCQGTSLYCTNGAWSDPDDNQAYCDNCVGSGNWVAGECCGDDGSENYCGTGEYCVNGNAVYDADSSQWACDNCEGSWEGGGGQLNCCGDDSGEGVTTCQDNGEGACSGSSDNTACCDDWDDCVFDGDCYNDGFTANPWRCNSGDWHDFVSPTTTHSFSGTMGNNNWYVSNVNVGLNCDDSSGSGCDETRYCRRSSGSCTPNIIDNFFTISNQGNSNIYYYSNDIAGNTESTKSGSFRIDSMDPVTSESHPAEPPSGWYTSPVTVTLSCSDATSGCVWTRYCTSWASCTPGTNYAAPININTEGTTYVRYRSMDSAGNRGSIQTETIQLDWNDPVTTPALSGTMGNNGWYVSNVQVDLSCSDSGSGCDVTRYCRTSSGSCTPNIIDNSFTINNQGTSIIYYYSTDLAGNQEPTGNTNFQIDTVDPTSSESHAPTPPGGWYDAPVTFTLSCSDSGSGCEGVFYCTSGASCTPSTPYSGPFQVSNEGDNYVRYRSRDLAGNEDSIQIVMVSIDMGPPNAQIDAPTGGWTDQNFFDVSWSGSDGIGIDHYDIQYRRNGGSWTLWINDDPPGAPNVQTFGPISPVSPANMDLFEFRIYAEDLAGNFYDFSDNPQPYSSIRLDLVDPTTSMDPLPPYSPQNFTVRATGSDSESGIDSIECEIQGPTPGVWRAITDNCIPGAAGSDWIEYQCTLNNDGFYDFHCRSTDVAGNTGSYSPIVTTEIDSSPPDLIITYPDYIWNNSESLYLEWSSTSPDLDRFVVEYATDTFPGTSFTYQSWNTYGPPAPASTVSALFGELGSPQVDLQHGITYSFRVTAFDIAGNPRTATHEVTIDQQPPDITIDVRDENGQLIPSEFIPAGTVLLINITSTAYDAVSGVYNNTIDYAIYGESYRQSYLDCGSAPSQSYSICSTADTSAGRNDIQFTASTSTRYRVITQDEAGNIGMTRFFFSVTHPLVNFGSMGYFLSLGESRLIPVFVRNIQNFQDNITLNLTGTDTFSRFDFNCEEGHCQISLDRRNMEVYNMNPYEERVYYVRLISAEPGEYELNLTATSLMVPDLEDSDLAVIKTSYPVFFPGLEEWSIVLLLALAGISYGFLSRKPI